MISFLMNIDGGVGFAALTLLFLVVGAWSLRLSCWVCAVSAPDFWRALFTLLVLVCSNIVLRVSLYITDTPSSVATEYVAPTLTGAAVIAICLTTGPYSAVIVSIVHSVLTAVFFLGALVAAGAIIA